MAEPEIEGFKIGFHSSLSEPVTMAGIPRMIAVLNGTLTAVLALGPLDRLQQAVAVDQLDPDELGEPVGERGFVTDLSPVQAGFQPQ